MTDTKLAEAIDSLLDELDVADSEGAIKKDHWRRILAKAQAVSLASGTLSQPDPSAYAAGQRDMRERAVKEASEWLDPDSADGFEVIEAIRELPIDPAHTAALDRIRAEGRAEAQGVLERIDRNLKTLRAAASRGPLFSREVFALTDGMADAVSRAALSQPTNPEERT